MSDSPEWDQSSPPVEVQVKPLITKEQRHSDWLNRAWGIGEIVVGTAGIVITVADYVQEDFPVETLTKITYHANGLIAGYVFATGIVKLIELRDRRRRRINRPHN